MVNLIMPNDIGLAFSVFTREELDILAKNPASAAECKNIGITQTQWKEQIKIAKGHKK